MILRLFALLIVTLAPVAASAQGNCAPRQLMAANLARSHGETRQAGGSLADGSIMEVLANLDTGTWTTLVTRPNGVACIIGVGRGFAIAAADPAPMGDDG